MRSGDGYPRQRSRILPGVRPRLSTSLAVIPLCLTIVGCQSILGFEDVTEVPGGVTCDDGFQDADGDGECSPACTDGQCGEHGVCDETSGVAVCLCDDGYAGDDCSTCADGFQDPDGDETCHPSCEPGFQDDDGDGTCERNPCGEDMQDKDGDGVCSPACDEDACHSSQDCDDSTGTLSCTCKPGRQDNDGDGECTDSCEAVPCAGDKLCDDSTGTKECTCPAGKQDKDGDDFCMDECGPLTCKGHGVCDDVSGVATCTCELEYAGPDCGMCAPGYQDEDLNLTCESKCLLDPCNANNGNSCSLDAGGMVQCSCVAPYGGMACEVCNLGAPILDDRFDNGVLSTGGANSIDGGFTVFDNGGGTNGSATESANIAQILTATNSPGAEPLWGMSSLATFNPFTLSDGFTVVWQIDSATVPEWRGIGLSAQSGPGVYAIGSGSPSLAIQIGRTELGGPDIDLLAHAAGTHQYFTTPLDTAQLQNGFVGVLGMAPTGWNIELEGLDGNGDRITASGTWQAGFTPAELLDADTHVAASIQGDNSDAMPRVLNVDRITVFAGRCPGATPMLPP